MLSGQTSDILLICKLPHPCGCCRKRLNKKAPRPAGEEFGKRGLTIKTADYDDPLSLALSPSRGRGDFNDGLSAARAYEPEGSVFVARQRAARGAKASCLDRGSKVEAGPDGRATATGTGRRGVSGAGSRPGPAWRHRSGMLAARGEHTAEPDVLVPVLGLVPVPTVRRAQVPGLVVEGATAQHARPNRSRFRPGRGILSHGRRCR
jgi:hypothetical protein